MNEANISRHLAEQMGLQAHVAEDGKCYITVAGTEYEWDLFGNGPHSAGQIGLRFQPWTAEKHLPADPVQAAIATGYEPS